MAKNKKDIQRLNGLVGPDGVFSNHLKDDILDLLKLERDLNEKRLG